MKKTALILDAGGVLVYPAEGDWNIPLRLREYLGARADELKTPRFEEACKKHAALIREDIFVADTEEEYNQRERFLGAVAADLGWNFSEETIMALADDFTYNPARYAWYSDVDAYLAAWAKNMRIGVLSDAMPSFAAALSAHPGANEYFCAVGISTEIGSAKPAAKNYQIIAQRMGVDLADCLFVDDREENLRGAQAVGMRAIQMARGNVTLWDGAAVTDFAGLDHVLETMP